MRMYRSKMSSADIRLLIELFVEGATVLEAAKRSGRNKNTVSKLFKRLRMGLFALHGETLTRPSTDGEAFNTFATEFCARHRRSMRGGQRSLLWTEIYWRWHWRDDKAAALRDFYTLLDEEWRAHNRFHAEQRPIRLETFNSSTNRLAPISRALVLEEPFASLVCLGLADMLLCEQRTRVRGTVAIVRREDKKILAVADFEGPGPAMRASDLQEAWKRHRLSGSLQRLHVAEGRTIPWVLADVRLLPEPREFRGRLGASAWATVPDDAAKKLAWFRRMKFRRTTLKSKI